MKKILFILFAISLTAVGCNANPSTSLTPSVNVGTPQNVYSQSTHAPAEEDISDWLTYSIPTLKFTIKYPSNWKFVEWAGPNQGQYNTAFGTNPDSHRPAYEITLKAQDDKVLNPAGGYLASMSKFYKVSLGQNMQTIQLANGVSAEELSVTNASTGSSFYILDFQENGYDYELQSGASISSLIDSIDTPWNMGRSVSFSN